MLPSSRTGQRPWQRNELRSFAVDFRNREHVLVVGELQDPGLSDLLTGACVNLDDLAVDRSADHRHLQVLLGPSKVRTNEIELGTRPPEVGSRRLGRKAGRIALRIRDRSLLMQLREPRVVILRSPELCLNARDRTFQD